MAETLMAQGLVKAFRGRRVVDNVSFQVAPGEIVGLLGPNGAGKTTSFYMVVGVIRADAGKVCLFDEEITRLPMYRRARKGISYLPQEPSVFRKLTVEENLAAIAETLPVDRKEAEKRVDSLLKELGIDHVRSNRAYSLSGGERRRVEIARALVTQPKFMLLDEPFAGIDPLALADLQNIIKELKEKKLGVLITDHNVRETLKICDRGYILNEGTILVEGSPEEITANPSARRFYLGEDFAL